MAKIKGGDKAAIMKVITDDHVAFLSKDFSTMARCWVRAAYVRHYGPAPGGGAIVFKGWAAISKVIKEAMAKLPDSDPKRAGHWTKVRVHAGRDMAWVTVSQPVRATGAPREVVRILEKHAGKWKLVYLGYLPEAA